MTLTAILFVFGVAVLLVGFLIRVGTSGFRDVSASFGVLFAFAIIMFCCGSVEGFRALVEGICGGFPLVDLLADYGSLHAALRMAPMAAAQAYFDVVLLALLINLIDAIPFVSSLLEGISERRKGSLGAFFSHMMGWVLARMLIALAATLLLNYVIKASGPYKWLFSSVGAVVLVLALVVAVLWALSRANRNLFAGGFRNSLRRFSSGSIAGACWRSVLESLFLFVTIFVLELRFGSVAAAFSTISAVVVAFLPSLLVILALAFILKRAFR